MNAILNFTVENFRSIRDRKTISFVPSKKITDAPIENVYVQHDIKYLRTAVIYGANSSGKSNLVQALDMMGYIVVDSVRMNDGDELLFDPFMLNGLNELKPTEFELDFVMDNVRYRYGFKYDRKRIHEEWLYTYDSPTHQTALFLRNELGIGIDEDLFPEGHDMEERTNDNRLFISLVGQLGGKVSKTIVNFFRERLNVVSGLSSLRYRSFSRRLLSENNRDGKQMLDFFQRVQLGFADLRTEMWDSDMNGRKHIRLKSFHNVYGDNGEVSGMREFDFEQMESEGTKKLFDMSGPIFDTLNTGSVIVIDELDAKMHPLISQEIVSLFNDPQRNPLGAQLVFTTHDTNLLSSHLLRRDQIWFTEKDAYEGTDVYNFMQIVLPDGTRPRGDGNIERNYIKGRYGAIPYIQTDLN